MKIRFLLLIVFFFSMSIIAPGVNAATKVMVTEKDKTILKEKLDKFSTKRNLSTGALMLAIGIDFMGTPYVAHTLDLDAEENLVVNLRELDCTTFVESVLAIALTIKSSNPSYETYLAELEKVRYRKGHLDGYVSRLHYFSEWITDNQEKGLVTDIAVKCGGVKYPVMLSFMGAHPDAYPQLKAHPEFVTKIKLIEKKVSEHEFYSIPKQLIPAHENEMKDGDIIALTTKIAGLDVTHLGLVCKKEGKLYLLNASSIGHKVETTPVPFVNYLQNSKSTTGIFLVRAN